MRPLNDQLALIVWDDAIVNDPPGCYRNFELVLRPHADNWLDDIRGCRPVCALLDNDMGSDHLRGTDVVRQVRLRFPMLTLVCISANAPACVYMLRSGLSCLRKPLVKEFLRRIDALLDKFAPTWCTPINDEVFRDYVQQSLRILEG